MSKSARDNSGWRQAHIHRAWEEIISRCERKIADHSSAFLGYEEKAVCQRLTQIVQAVGLIPFRRLCRQNIDMYNEIAPRPDSQISVGGLIISLRTRSVRPSLRYFIRSMAIFVVEWVVILWAMIKGPLIHNKLQYKSASLLFGFGLDNLLSRDKGEAFLQFCRFGPIRPLNETDKYVIYGSWDGEVCGDSILVTKYPIASLIREAEFSWRTRLVLLFNHLTVPFVFVAQVLHFPLVCLLARDIAETPALRQLDRSKSFKSFICTNAAMEYQPLWTTSDPESRLHRSHLVHYSQNGKDFIYKENSFYADYPALRHINVDEQWVWTLGFKEYLQSLIPKSTINVVGPILFYLPKPVLHKKPDEIRIAIFDVTPISLEMEKSIGFINNYYNRDNAIRFIQEIIEVVSEIESVVERPFKILLKHKRKPVKNAHSSYYSECVDKLSRDHENFDLISPTENLYSFIESSDVSISIPYTSTAYVADHLCKPSIYFDSTVELLPNFEPGRNLHFASGRTELKDILSSIILAKVDSGTEPR